MNGQSYVGKRRECRLEDEAKAVSGRVEKLNVDCSSATGMEVIS